MKPFSMESLSYQIRHLSEVDRLSANQIAQHLNISRHRVLKILKEDISSPILFRLRIEYLGKGDENNVTPLEGWHREIQLSGEVTLNELNDIIQQVIGWDNAHLYLFSVNNKQYAYLGSDDYIVEEIFENHLSATILLNTIGLRENDRFIYNYDFGDNHFFLLTVLEIEKTDNRKSLPRVIGFAGCDLVQYPSHDNHIDDEEQIFSSETTENVKYKEIIIPWQNQKGRDRIAEKIDFITAAD